jgi:predicted ATPase with chaperone activity
MLARRLTSILPAMTLADLLEITRLPRVVSRTGARPAFVTICPPAV